MLISIIMPVRNTARYLRTCIDSIINQNFTNWELITVENNSDDNCLEILREYARKDQRIKVYHNPNGDLITALQLATSKVRGDIITRMDSDDIMPIYRIKETVDLLTKHGHGHVVTGMVEYFSDDKEILGYKRYEEWLNHLMMNETNFNEIYKECVIPSPCWMMHTVDFFMIGAFNHDTYPEDYDLCFRMYEANIKVLTVKKTLHHWRDYHNRNSRTDPNYADQLFFDLKIKYFLKCDYRPKRSLVLWGVGKKGKNLAKLLISNGIEFDWITENPNKIGKHVYDILIQNTGSIKQNSQVLIVVSNEQEQNEINAQLEEQCIQYFNFC